LTCEGRITARGLGGNPISGTTAILWMNLACPSHAITPATS
jgi:hypothetical protein